MARSSLQPVEPRIETFITSELTRLRSKQKVRHTTLRVSLARNSAPKHRLDIRETGLFAPPACQRSCCNAGSSAASRVWPKRLIQPCTVAAPAQLRAPQPRARATAAADALTPLACLDSPPEAPRATSCHRPPQRARRHRAPAAPAARHHARARAGRVVYWLRRAGALRGANVEPPKHRACICRAPRHTEARARCARGRGGRRHAARAPGAAAHGPHR